MIMEFSLNLNADNFHSTADGQVTLGGAVELKGKIICRWWAFRRWPGMKWFIALQLLPGQQELPFDEINQAVTTSKIAELVAAWEAEDVNNHSDYLKPQKPKYNLRTVIFSVTAGALIFQLVKTRRQKVKEKKKATATAIKPFPN